MVSHIFKYRRVLDITGAFLLVCVTVVWSFFASQVGDTSDDYVNIEDLSQRVEVLEQQVAEEQYEIDTK